MKNILAALIATAFLASFVTSARAEKVDIKGEALCAKCELHETDHCQTAIRTKVDGKDVIYYAENNAVAKKFHSEICHGPAKVHAKGEVTEKDGKKMIKLTKIEIE